MSAIAPGGRIADRYHVLEELGRGGMGVVYLARDEREQRDVAIKVLREAPEGEGARRLQREARAMGVLDPKGVAQVFEVGQTPSGELYLVMEYVRGRTLRSMLRKGRIEKAEALKILRQLATTLGQAHRAGLVHRDVKPDNVMVREDGRAVLLDFGIVKRLAVGEETANLSTQLTAEGSVIGTPAYLSPEQALGRAVGPQTDQFALGVMAYELLAGKLPWTATEMTTMLAQVLAETPQPPSSIDTMLSPSFDAVLSRALQKSPAHRFSSTDELADALEAADRGEYVPLEVSETVIAPATTIAGGHPPTLRSGSALRRVWVGAVFAAAAGAIAIGVARRGNRVSADVDTAALAAAALAGPGARLACPIFEVRGIADVATRLGAAGATVACVRATWFLGGRDDRVLPPAALLDVPRQSTPSFDDPYVSAQARRKTLDLATARGTAYLDGLVTREPGSWHVDLFVKAPDGKEIAHANGQNARYLAAVSETMNSLWRAPLARQPVDPDVARWRSAADADVGLATTDLSLLGSPGACASIRAHAHDLGNAFFTSERLCEALGAGAGPDAGLLTLDESSAPALAASLVALSAWESPIPPEEAHRLSAKLDELKAHEPTGVGRAALAYAAGTLSSSSNDAERAQSEFSLVVREDPLNLDAWRLLVTNASLSSAATSSVAAAWFPSESMFLVKAGSYRGDEIVDRIRDAQLAFELEPTQLTAMHFGRALAEAGRAEEARTVGATRLDSSDERHGLETYILAYLDLHNAKISHGIARLGDVGNIGMNDLVVAADVAGTIADVSDKWAARFLSLPDDKVDLTARGYDAPIVLCMRAGRALAKNCLDRVARLGHASVNYWGEGGDALLEGAFLYARGDVRAAVATWRPLVAAPNLDIVGILPTEAFERAGQPDLAARLDARKLPYTFIAGVSEAAPREAKRALAAGDKARARDLAQKVISAWEVADVEVPAVAEMRALLQRIHE